jgi:hypothetical protein
MIHLYNSNIVVEILVGAYIGSWVIGGRWRDWFEGDVMICSIGDVCRL